MGSLKERAEKKDRFKIKERTMTAAAPYRLRLVNEPEKPTFSFLALGDSGAFGKKKPGSDERYARAKYHVADMMQTEDAFDFILHLGDVVYLSGSKKGYRNRFIGPYHHWLRNGTGHAYDDMVFTKPFLPVYGNHDYYDLAKVIPTKLLSNLARKLVDATGLAGDLIGKGSKNGKVFQQAFVETDTSRVQDGQLDYITGERTRIPNRYYWFTHGPCVFIALDSNTLDSVREIPAAQRKEIRQEIEKREAITAVLRAQIEGCEQLFDRGDIGEDEVKLRVHFLVSALAEEEKHIAMLETYLDAEEEDLDTDQINWLQDILARPEVQDRWKIVYMHHPLYSSDSSHTNDPESAGLRANLREMLVAGGVHLVLSGHSHCFEWLQRALPTDNPAEERLAQAERRICYIVSGGAGQKLRPSILEVAESTDEVITLQRQFLQVAESKAYAAKFGQGATEQDVYSYLRVEVQPDRLRVIPVGVMDIDGAGKKHRPLLTKVFRAQGPRITVDATKRLEHIEVFGDRPPEAAWWPAG